jgi:antitoxin VapB
VNVAGLPSEAGAIEKRHYRAKVFKSGNSLAVRIPAGTKLVAGMEMDLTVVDGDSLSLQPATPAKRKFNIAKVWGCAIGSGLQMIDPEDRFFEERPLKWDDAEPPLPIGDP